VCASSIAPKPWAWWLDRGYVEVTGETGSSRTSCLSSGAHVDGVAADDDADRCDCDTLVDVVVEADDASESVLDLAAGVGIGG
jgi:hypothetical protein